MSIAINVVDIGIRTAQQHEVRKINEIVIEVGSLAGVETEALIFCYESACRGTIAEGSRLSLIRIPAQAKCSSCNHVFDVEVYITPCPNCGEPTFDVRGGRELRVKSINVD